eukprot:766045-Hanusia_phi.AAC.1
MIQLVDETVISRQGTQVILAVNPSLDSLRLLCPFATKIETANARTVEDLFNLPKAVAHAS